MLDELSQLALKYRADKWSSQYSYTPIYYKLFKKRQNTIKKVLEIGIGEEAAGLRIWQEFFPNAKIYGVDYRQSVLVNQDRIESFLYDQRRTPHLLNLINKIGQDIDIVIDDGSHRPRDQISTCKTLMPLLKKDVIYIIEDAADPSIVEQFSLYKSKMIIVGKHNDDRLIVVKNKTKLGTYEYILKKYNIDPVGQSFIEIPNIGRNSLAELFAELKFSKGAEIGVSLGHYSEILCKANPKLHLYSIDPWNISSYPKEANPAILGVLPHNERFDTASQERFDGFYSETKKRLALYNCTVIRKDSLTAALDFADNSLDFVYIDANHDYLNIANDLHTWKRKVRPGGILAGHDYENFGYKRQNHVKQVVQTYMPSYNMLPCFIVGSSRGREKGEVRDRIRSWFWVKTEIEK